MNVWQVTQIPVTRHIVSVVSAAVMLAMASGASAAPNYPWAPSAAADTIADRFTPPPGFRRTAAHPGSYAEWLRGLPLKPAGVPVRLHTGRLKANQSVHAAVIDIDVGRRDLQQCADAIIRLRAEYLYSRRHFSEIAFRFTSGDDARFSRWAQGWRPKVRGNRVTWVKRSATGMGRASFASYLRTVFIYAGTISVRRDLQPIAIRNVNVGDVFVEAGSPGHAVLVVDLAVDGAGRKVMLLAQSYMPAQNFHVLRNLNSSRWGAWYPVPTKGRVVTPEWTFRTTDLRRFR
ncbi:MAG: DUF4846 domain-containing protein [Pseudomonadota bacterium]